MQVPSTDSDQPPIVYNTPSPDRINFVDELVPEYEGVLLKSQPRIRAFDVSVRDLTIIFLVKGL